MDISTAQGRAKFIEKLEGNSNLGRKSRSYKAAQVYKDKTKPYVVEALREQFSEQTVKEMPVISQINVAKRVINKLATVYQEQPVREFQGVSEEQENTLFNIYDDMDINKKMSRANRYFKNQEHCLIQILPKHGRLSPRVFQPHQWDYIPSMIDAEIAKGYVISGYDSYYEMQEAADAPGSATGTQTTYSSNSELYSSNKALGKQEEENKKHYLFWTKENNFVCDAKGNIIGEVMDNPIQDLPFVEVFSDKEYEYWVDSSNSTSEFSIEFAVQLSLLAQVCKMQGFAQAYLKGPKEALAENVQTGPNYVLHLINDAAAGIECEFGYASPNSDIAGCLSFIESLLAGFLSSLGVDPKTVSMKGEGATYTSGLERLLAMIENLSASREDYDTFEKVEYKIFELVKKWLKVLSNSETLDRKYWLSSLPDSAEMTVQFHKPEMITSEKEQLDMYQQEVELGIASPITILMEKYNLTREQAEEKYNQIQMDLGVIVNVPEIDDESMTSINALRDTINE